MRSSWKPPEELVRRSRESFKQFRERVLVFHYGRAAYDSMTRDERSRKFLKHFPGRSVKHYTANFERGRAVIRTTTKRVPIKVFKSKGVLTDEFREMLPLKPGPTCRYRGTVPFPVGFRPQKIRSSSPLWPKFLSETGRGDVFWLDPERVEVSGSWPSQIAELQAMCDETKHDCDYSRLRDALQDRLNSNLHIPSIDPPKPDEVFSVKTNQKAFPGVITSRYIGNTHKEADPVCRHIAYDLFNTTSRGIMPDNSLWGICGRSRFQKYEEGSQLRSRLILAPEAPQKIFQLCYAQKIYDILPAFVKQYPNTACQIGLNYQYGGFSAFEEAWSGVNNLVADLKRHDQNNSELYMVGAFAIIRSFFPRSKIIDRHFLHFMSGTIFKNVVVPGRFIFKILKGNPSGTPFTSLLSTFCNVLQWGVTLRATYGAASSRVPIAAYGDDTIGKIPNSLRLIHEDTMVKAHFKHTGQTCSPFSYQNWWARDPGNRPTFLKTYSNNGFPARMISDTISPMSNPSKNDAKDIALMCTTLCYTSPFNIELTELILAYRDWLRELWLDGIGFKDDRTALVGPLPQSVTRAAAFKRFALKSVPGFTESKARMPWADGTKATCGFEQMATLTFSFLKDKLEMPISRRLSIDDIRARKLAYARLMRAAGA